MGIYLNPGNGAFGDTINSPIYVDKTDLLEMTNTLIDTENKYICVSRPRRFGKSMTAKMLVAYYDNSCDSKELFKTLKIASHPSFQKYLNRSYVIYLDISWFRSIIRQSNQLVSVLQTELIQELKDTFPNQIRQTTNTLPMALAEINSRSGTKFIFIIDEWDCLFREDKSNRQVQQEYIDLLQGLFKSAPSQKFIQLAYITGILPVKKYGTQSALNNFKEFTMINPKAMAPFTGFTEKEVQSLCHRFSMDFEALKHWYDGYSFRREPSVYNPNSVVEAISNGEIGNYWTETETYEDLKLYIHMDFNGLKTAIIHMLGGGHCKIQTRTFQNDMTSIKNKDDVMTLLVHLGYLAYNRELQEVYIPNQEIVDEFKNAIEDGGWHEIISAPKASEKLLQATFQKNTDFIAKHLDKIHQENTSILEYNSELSLSCIITVAYFYARKEYTLIRELPAGKGFADIAFVPHKNSDKPAFIVELKWDNSAHGAISQIKEKQYAGVLKEFSNKLLLVGISYNKKNKQHECVIEDAT